MSRPKVFHVEHFFTFEVMLTPATEVESGTSARRCH
jgi:hypothetical protein